MAKNRKAQEAKRRRKAAKAKAQRQKVIQSSYDRTGKVPPAVLAKERKLLESLTPEQRQEYDRLADQQREEMEAGKRTTLNLRECYLRASGKATTSSVGPDELALRKAIQEIIQDGSPVEVYKFVAQKVDKVAREQLPGRSPQTVALAQRDVRDKLLTIATEELLKAGYDKEVLQSEIEKFRLDATTSSQIHDFVRVQLLKGTPPEEIEKQVNDRWGSLAEGTDWRGTAYEAIRTVLDNASPEDVAAILKGAREQSPEALKYVQDIVAERVLDEAAQIGIHGNAERSAYTPMRPLQQSQERTTPQEQTVDAYMEALANAYHLTRASQDPERKRESVYIWRCLRDARVFHFDPDVYVGLHQEIDRYTTEELAGYTYRPPGSFKPHEQVPPEEADALRAAILRESRHAPYPDKFPFPCVFLGYGYGVQLPKHYIMLSAPRAIRDNLELAGIAGHLMTDDGSAYLVIKGSMLTPTGRTGVLWFDPLRAPSGGWVRSESNLEPWILPALIRIINDHRTFIIENAMSRGLRKDYKQNRKGMGIKPGKRAYTPPPFYTLRMKSQVIREKVRKGLPRPAAPKTYKTDVRAHERCRIARGPLPLDPETGAKLRKRGYTIFTANALDVDTYRRLHERGLPYKKSDEWLAILVTWVEEHMTCNDPNLPYIPAVRLPGEVRLKPRQPTGGWRDDPRS